MEKRKGLSSGYPVYLVHPDFQRAVNAIAVPVKGNLTLVSNLQMGYYVRGVARSPYMIRRLTQLASIIGYQGEVFGDEVK